MLFIKNKLCFTNKAEEKCNTKKLFTAQILRPRHEISSLMKVFLKYYFQIDKLNDFKAF